MIKHKLLFIVGLFFAFTIAAQDIQPVQFDFKKADNGKGEFILTITAKPASGIKLFSIQKISDDLLVNTAVSFDAAIKKYLQDSLIETGNLQTEKDASLDNAVIKFYTDSLQWKQKIKLSVGDSTRITGTINYYYKKGESVESGEKRISKQFDYKDSPVTLISPVAADTSFENKSWIILLLLGMGAGLLAFITPCVYALVPVTVSLFLKRSKTALQGRKNVLFYAVSIILIYTALCGYPYIALFVFNNILYKITAYSIIIFRIVPINSKLVTVVFI